MQSRVGPPRAAAQQCSGYTLYIRCAGIRSGPVLTMYLTMQAAAAVAQAYDLDELDDEWKALLNELEDRLLQVL